MGKEGTPSTPIPGKRALGKNTCHLRGVGNRCPQGTATEQKGGGWFREQMVVEGGYDPPSFKGSAEWFVGRGRVGKWVQVWGVQIVQGS